MGAFDAAWLVVKAPLFEADFDSSPGHAVWDITSEEEERQNQFNHLFPTYMKTPLQGETYGGMGDIYWTSADDMARGSATSRNDDIHLHHFEIADTLRGQNRSQAYLQEMIDELKQRFSAQNPLVHATKVDWEVAPYWNKMVDRGVISSASEQRFPRYTDDKKYIAPRIWDDKLIPVEELRDRQ